MRMQQCLHPHILMAIVHALLLQIRFTLSLSTSVSCVCVHALASIRLDYYSCIRNWNDLFLCLCVCGIRIARFVSSYRIWMSHDMNPTIAYFTAFFVYLPAHTKHSKFASFVRHWMQSIHTWNFDVTNKTFAVRMTFRVFVLCLNINCSQWAVYRLHR